ncbi:unnamed protein product [Amoebophrya sp. A25]|nr:unnamed protein product [Amoebophrya sp. A25]|eukprot:GSA25T00026279001.1
MNFLLDSFALLPELTRIPPSTGNGVAASASCSLAGRRALVVGGTKGIGRGTAIALAESGCATVDVVGRDRIAGASVVQAIEAVARGSGDRQDVVGQSNSTSASSSSTATASSPGVQVRAQFLSADLSSVKGCRNFVSQLSASGEPSYDILVFTVGAWPDFKNPLTSDGFNRVLFLDVFSRYLLIQGLLSARSDSASLVMSVLASGQKLSAGGQSKEERQAFLEEKVLSRHITPEARAAYRENTVFMKTLGCAGCAHDHMLAALAEKHKQVKFVGTFPGLVETEVMFSTLGDNIFSRGLNFLGRAVPAASGMQTIEECGRAHVDVIKHQLSNLQTPSTSSTTSTEQPPKNLSFWSAVHRSQRQLPDFFGLQSWFLEKLDSSLSSVGAE